MVTPQDFVNEAMNNLDFNSGLLVLDEKTICAFCGSETKPVKQDDKWLQTCHCKEREHFLQDVQDLNNILNEYRTKKLKLEKDLTESAESVFKKWWIQNKYPLLKNDLEEIYAVFMGICK
jgi:hypothetical protein